LTAGSNYTLSFAGANFKITQRPITVIANARRKVSGKSDPVLTYQITSGNLVGEDSISGTLARNAGEDVGIYDIIIGSLTLGSNYILTFEGASFTIFDDFSVIVYPNPFSDHITFELELNNNANISIDIYNLTGIKLATVFSGTVEGTLSHFDYLPQHLASGVLIYQLTIDGIIMATGTLIHE
jgi:hypothetical protein